MDFIPNLRRYAIILTRSRDLADDLVQTTAEKALAARERFDPGTRFDAWLFRIMRNAWIDMTRRARTRGTELDMDTMPEAASVDGTRVVEAKLMLESARRAMDELPAEQREVMLLVCVEGMSYKEAANVIGVPKGTVMSRLSRARLAVANRMGINPSPKRSSGHGRETQK